MKQAAANIRAGEDVAAAVASAADVVKGAGFALDYLEVRHAETLAPIASSRMVRWRMLVRAKLGRPD